MKTTDKDLQKASGMLEKNTNPVNGVTWMTTTGRVFFSKKAADYAQLAINKGFA